MLARLPGIGMVAARVKIHGGVALFGPRVYRQMRLCQDDRSRHALGLETVKGALHNRRVRHLGGANHHGMDVVDVREGLRVTPRQFAHDVRTECLQFFFSPRPWGKSHLRTTSAGACSAVTSPTYRRTLAGAFRCASVSPRWRVGRACPSPWFPLLGSLAVGLAARRADGLD